MTEQTEAPARCRKWVRHHRAGSGQCPNPAKVDGLCGVHARAERQRVDALARYQAGRTAEAEAEAAAMALAGEVNALLVDGGASPHYSSASGGYTGKVTLTGEAARRLLDLARAGQGAAS